MYINEIPKDSEITLNVKNDKKSVSFPLKKAGVSEVTNSKESSVGNRFLLTEPIYYNGKPVNLIGNGSMTYGILAVVDGRKVQWLNTKAEIVKTENGTVYSFSTPKEGREENRRNSFRLDVGRLTNASSGSESFEAIVENISEGGVCISVHPEDFENSQIKKGSVVKISFVDDFENKGKMRDLHYDLNVVVIRHENKERSVHIGCSFVTLNPESAEGVKLNQYIQAKQRERMRAGRR